jgi:signal transduction histidine kinase/AmiR/NasT family two-component response regulator
MSSNLPHNRGAVRRIAALAAVIVAIVVAGSLALLSFAASSVDKIQVSEERALVSNYLQHNQRELVRTLVSVSVWDEAYESLSAKPDLEWADTNVGRYYADYHGHALSIVVDDRNAPIYAWRGESRIVPADSDGFLKDAASLIAAVRDEETVRRRRGMSASGLPGSSTTSGVLRSQGRVYFVAVASIVPETDAPADRPAFLLISARTIDSGFLQELDADLRIADSRISPAPSGEIAALPLVHADGSTLGELAWTPKKPGIEVLRDAVPLFIVAALVLIAAGVGLTVRIRAVFRELTAHDEALHGAMDDLVRARDEAAAANAAKSQFLANMSHEIRTPLNGILGMTQIMAREDLSPAQRERLDVVRDSGQTLLTVLNDILDISKIEAGKLDIDNHEFDLTAAVRAACNPFAAEADEKDVAFRIAIDEDACGVWWGDGARLRQVISNLASNAVKFTLQGSVVVSARRRGDRVRFTVEDTGIGIPPERLGDLFDKFSQVDASTTRKFGGTGLGLAISRELVTLMGGAMIVESIPGQGSTFTFDLPLTWRAPTITAPLPPPAHQARAPETAAAPRILAAEDNPTNQLILRALLEPFGLDLTMVSNGREAVDAFSGGRFEIVLMDVQMPVMNGVEATAAIRRLEAERGLPATPILALSANVMSHQVAEYLAAGMTGFVPKPIEGAKLLAAMDEAWESVQASETLAVV